MQNEKLLADLRAWQIKIDQSGEDYDQYRHTAPEADVKALDALWAQVPQVLSDCEETILSCRDPKIKADLGNFVAHTLKESHPDAVQQLRACIQFCSQSCSSAALGAAIFVLSLFARA